MLIQFYFMLDTTNDKFHMTWMAKISDFFFQHNPHRSDRFYDNILKALKAALVQLVVPDSR